MSKIRNLTIVNQQGISSYTVGDKYYGLLLDNIKCHTLSGDDVHVPHFSGFTEDNQLVFEAISAPIEVSYCSDS